MARYFAPLSWFLLTLLVISGKKNMLSKVEADDCRGGYLSTIGGGCPDVYQCKETCRPCYRGVGVVTPYCVAPGGPTPYWECRCGFDKGAPCPPPAPPKCPALWPPSASTTAFNDTLIFS